MSRERIDRRHALILEIVRDRGGWISGDGRISEADAAHILGWTPGALKAARHEGRAPPHFELGAGKGSRVSYCAYDLAEWIEDRRENSGER